MMKKVTKSQVIAKLKKMNEGETLQVSLFPSNCGPANTVWVKPYENGLYRKGNKILADNWNEPIEFNDLINSFSYYNCNNELGKRVHFYIEE